MPSWSTFAAAYLYMIEVALQLLKQIRGLLFHGSKLQAYWPVITLCCDTAALQELSLATAAAKTKFVSSTQGGGLPRQPGSARCGKRQLRDMTTTTTRNCCSCLQSDEIASAEVQLTSYARSFFAELNSVTKQHEHAVLADCNRVARLERTFSHSAAFRIIEFKNFAENCLVTYLL